MITRRMLTLVTMLSVLVASHPVNSTAIGEFSLPTGNITAHKFNDLDQNGVQNGDEANLADWPLRVYKWDEGQSPALIAESSTNQSGEVTFGDLEPGRYKVWEAEQECWKPTTPVDSWDGGYYQVVYLVEGESAVVEFGNVYHCPSPSETCIDLEKTGPETAHPGETITYHFWLHNCGDVTLGGSAQVYDSLFGPDPIWSGDLEPAEVIEFDWAYTLPDDNCGELANTAHAVGHSSGYPDVTDQDDWTVLVICEPEPTPVVDVEKFVSIDGEDWHDADTPSEAIEVRVGSDVYFRFWVKNAGNVELTQVTLSDSHYDVTNCPLTDPLAPGVSFECVVGPLTAAEGWHVNTATATGEYGGTTCEDTDRAKYYGIPPLKVWKTTATLWKRTYDWTISKSVQPDSLELAQGESGDMIYSIEAERGIASNTYAVKGVIYARNDMESIAHLVDVVDCIEYHNPGKPGPEPEGFTTLTCKTIQTGGTIAPGVTASWGYRVDFAPVPDADTYRNRTEVTISNYFDGEHTFTYRQPFDLPTEPTSEEGACATVTDEQTVPDGFSTTDDYPDGGWHVCHSDVFTIGTTLTNDNAGAGTYYLHNTATLTEEDSADRLSDVATVTITVSAQPRPCLRIRKTLDGVFTDPYTGQPRAAPTDLIHVSAGWPAHFHLTIEVENCGSVDLTDVAVTDVIENQVAPREILDYTGGDVTGLRPSGEDGFGLDPIVWTIGDLPAGRSAYLVLLIETLRETPQEGGKYAPTLPDQDIESNEGAAVRAVALGFGTGQATTEIITLSLEPISDEDISIITPPLPYYTPWAEAVFESDSTAAKARLAQTGQTGYNRPP